MSSNLITITDASRFAPVSGLQSLAKQPCLRTADYRRLLSEMRMRPPSQRAFLKKLLKRAVLVRTYGFPVPNHAATNLVDHT